MSLARVPKDSSTYHTQGNDESEEKLKARIYPSSSQLSLSKTRLVVNYHSKDA
jgi:hypothetical protein